MVIDMQFITNFLVRLEARKLKAYIPCDVTPEAKTRIGKKTRNYTGDNGNPADYTAMGASGVTIGTGVDLGQQTYAGLLNKGVPAALVCRFEPYLGKSGEAAIQALYAAPFSITDLECDALDRAVIADYVRRVARMYDEQSDVPFADIPREAQAVIAHLFYHLGSPKKYQRTWAALIRQNWQAASDELCNGALWSGPYDWGRKTEGDLLASILEAK